MKKINAKNFLKAFCSVLALLLCASLLVGCKSSKLSPDKAGLEVVGKIGSYDVLYEELYFVANAHKKDGMTSEELWDKVGESMLTNYAILTLCDNVGVSLSDKELDRAAQEYVDSIVSELGSRSKYFEFLDDNGLTDNYVRFTAKVDALYDQVPLTLAEKGQMLTGYDQISEYALENFVRTHHFMVANNKGDDAQANKEIVENALAEIRDGTTSVYKLIGGKYNEDLLISANGYIFGKGVMEKEYEDAAFDLKVGEISDVVCAKGELANGEYVDCYYIIERLELDADFIKKNYDQIYTSYVDSLVGGMLSEVKSSLKFAPNDYGTSLNVLELEDVSRGTDTATIVTLCSIAGTVLVLATVITVSVIRFRKKEAARAKAKLELAAKKGGAKK